MAHDKDEGIRPGTTAETLGKLETLVSMGNAAGSMCVFGRGRGARSSWVERAFRADTSLSLYLPTVVTCICSTCFFFLGGACRRAPPAGVCPALPEVPDGVLTAGNASQVRPAPKPCPRRPAPGVPHCARCLAAPPLRGLAWPPGRLGHLGQTPVPVVYLANCVLDSKPRAAQSSHGGGPICVCLV